MRGNEELEHKNPAGNAVAYAVLFSNCRPVYDEPHLKFFTFSFILLFVPAVSLMQREQQDRNNGQSQLSLNSFYCFEHQTVV